MSVRPALRALTAIGVIVGLALPGASYAETFRHVDPARDVQSVDETGAATTDKPRNKSADVTRVTFRHTRSQLRTTPPAAGPGQEVAGGR